MFRRAGPATLGEYVRQSYPLLRDVRPGSLRQFVIAVDLLERWAGGPVRLDQLDEQTVSAWLRDYSATVRPATVRAKKAAILALWRAAADDGLAQDPVARRVRRVRVPERVVQAWTREEVERLLEAAATLPRWHGCGLRRSAWWDLAIRVAWDTGLRWGDLVALRADALGPDGTGVVVQSKTGRAITVRLSPGTLEALRASLAACPRDLVCPWPASGETFRAQVDRLVARAGIRAGTWKWIRRGSGTDVELQAEGAGHRHLGNTQAVFRASYEDPAIVGRRTPRPRELLIEALSRTAAAPPVSAIDGEPAAPVPASPGRGGVPGAGPAAAGGPGRPRRLPRPPPARA
jgi:integrase